MHSSPRPSKSPQVSQKTQVVLLHHLGSLGQFNVPAKVKGRFYSKRMCN